MEDLHQEYLGRGLTDEEAEAAVVEHFDLSEDVLRELVRVHDTPLQRSLEGLSGQVRGPWSRLLMVFLALFVTGGIGDPPGSGAALSGCQWVGLGHPAHPGPGLGDGRAAGLTDCSVQARPVEPGRPVRSRASPGVGGSHCGRAAAGLWVELYLSALRIRAVPGETLVHLVGWLHMASATLVIALSGALVLGFLWFFLESRVRRQELTAVANLLEGIS